MHLWKLSCLFVAVALLAGCGGGGGSAPPDDGPMEVIDSSWDPTNQGNFSPQLVGNRQWGQTFTIGGVGQLTKLHIWVEPIDAGAALTVDIRPAVGDLPENDDSSVLASANIGLSGIAIGGDWVEVDFTFANLQVQAGERYAFVVQRAGGLAGGPDSGANPGSRGRHVRALGGRRRYVPKLRNRPMMAPAPEGNGQLMPPMNGQPMPPMNGQPMPPMVPMNNVPQAQGN